jgi:hypothetical protein
MTKRIALLMLFSLPRLWGGDLPPDVRAKVVRILATSIGSPHRVACKDPTLMAELARAGFVNDPGAPVAYASSEEDVRAMRRQGRLVICGRTSMLASGAQVAVVEEDGRPQIFFHMAHLAGSGVVISDSVLKIGRKF